MRGIVCGLGQVGYRIARLALQSGYRVTIVALTAREEWQREIEALGGVFFIGDARDEKLLQSAGLANSAWLISATARDLTNIEIALDAKRLNPKIRTVARVFDQNLAHRLETTFGIDRVLAMSWLAAPAFISAAFGDQVVSSFTWEGEPYGVVRVRVTDEHAFAGRSLASIQEDTGLASLLFVGQDTVARTVPSPELVLQPGDAAEFVGSEASIRSLGTFPIRKPAPALSNRQRRPRRHILRHLWRNAPRDMKGLLLGLLTLIMLSTIVFKVGMKLSPVDAFYFVVSTVTTTGYGDITPKQESAMMKLFTCLVMLLGSAAVATLYSIITDALVRARIQELTTGHPVPDEDHVIVVGLGNVGFRTCEELIRLGIEPVGIDLDPETKFATTLRENMAVIAGDAREAEILEKANFSTATAIIVATSDDAVNLSVGLVAHEEPGNQRIVLRLFDDRFARKVQSTVAFDAAFSASAIATPTFLGSACYPDSVASFVIGEHFVTLFARNPSSRLTGPKEREVLRRPNGSLITVLVRRIDVGPTGAA